MNKKLLIISAFVSLGAFAQDYEWQWARRGGGIKLSPNETATAYNFDSEQILDIAVDSDNNYYYLAFMTEQDTQYEDLPITVYNSQPQVTGSTDIVLLSTDCEGTFRWSQTIGGGGTDYAYKIILDNNGGLYIGANVMNLSNFGSEYLPPHFSPLDAMPVLDSDTSQPQPGYKTIAIVKYKTNDGSLDWRVMPQGEVSLALRYGSINQLALESDGTVHALVGFMAGTHLNGNIVVPESFTNIYKYYIIKLTSDGDYEGNIPLALEGVLLENNTEFRYDENLDRYYISGFRTNGDIFALSPLSLNGTELEEQAYAIAFNNVGTSIWSKELSVDEELKDNRIYDLKIDDNSNLYLAGKYFITSADTAVNFGEYEFPTNIMGNVPFVLKINASGIVQWITIPSGYTTPEGFFTGAHYYYSLALNGNEIGVATQVDNEMWGTVSINRPANHRSDPGLLRLNRNTGAAIALHDIMAIEGYDDSFTAIAADNDGNYIAGGYFYYNLFTAQDDNVSTVNKVMGQADGTDFFIVKLASGPCGETSGTKDFNHSVLELYPNPTSDIVNIVTDESLRSYEVVSMLGQVLLKGDFENPQKIVSIQSLSAGTYMLNLKTADNKIITQKIIRQ